MILDRTLFTHHIMRIAVSPSSAQLRPPPLPCVMRCTTVKQFQSKACCLSMPSTPSFHLLHAVDLPSGLISAPTKSGPTASCALMHPVKKMAHLSALCNQNLLLISCLPQSSNQRVLQPQKQRQVIVFQWSATTHKHTQAE